MAGIERPGAGTTPIFGGDPLPEIDPSNPFTGGGTSGGGTGSPATPGATNSSSGGTFTAGKNNPLNITQATNPLSGLIGLLGGQIGAYGPSFSQGPGSRGLATVFNTAMGESFQSQDRAANRLRERMTGFGRAQEQQLRDRAAESGGAATGFFNQNLTDLAGQQGQAYAQGLVQLEDSFADNRNQLLNTALGAAQGAQQGEQFLQELAQQGFEFNKGTAADLLATAGDQAVTSQTGFNNTLADIFLGNQDVIAKKQIADAQNKYANFSDMWDALVALVTSGQAGNIV